MYAKVNDIIRAGRGAVLTTGESLTIPIDYDDGDVGSVGDPPAGTIFQIQSDVDNLLSSNGWTAFKHLQAAIEALPMVEHSVVFELAAGVHRPRPVDTSYAWDCSVISFSIGSLSIHGASASYYTTILSNEIVTGSHSDTIDTYLDCSGASFPVDGSLKGKYAILSTGQILLVHDNTATRLHVTAEIVPVPTNGVDMVRIGRPGTILRNSLNDSTRHASFSVLAYKSSLAFPVGSVQDLQIDNFGGTSMIFRVSTGNTLAYLSRYMVDYEYQRINFGVSAGSRNIQLSGYSTNIIAQHCSFGATAANRASGNPLYIGGDATLQLRQSYIGEITNRIWVQPGGLLTLALCVLDNIGGASEPSIEVLDAQLEGYDASYLKGVLNTIRNKTGAAAGIKFYHWGRARRNDYNVFWFKNMTGPCVQLMGGAIYDIRASSVGLRDGGGNLDVGIEIVSAGNTVLLNAGTDVTGLAGDLRIQGVVGSYSSIGTVANPTITDLLNIIGRG